MGFGEPASARAAIGAVRGAVALVTRVGPVDELFFVHEHPFQVPAPMTVASSSGGPGGGFCWR